MYWRREFFVCWVFLLAMPGIAGAADPIHVCVPPRQEARIDYGVQRLRDALVEAGAVVEVHGEPPAPLAANTILIGTTQDGARFANAVGDAADASESYVLLSLPNEGTLIAGAGAAGAMYGCLDLARRVAETRGLPASLDVRQTPAMSLRGTAILLMKLGLYDYPITPEEFPFFYDKRMWLEYLDFLAANRFNYIAFWNGHPFDYFVKLDKYPEAQDGMPPGILERNHEMLTWLTREAQRRNIWLMFQFYQIHTSVYFAKAHGLDPHGSSQPTPLLTDYTKHCIERFVSEFPGVGLYVCPGERLRLRFVADWINEVILFAVKKTGKNPPIMIRSWGIDVPNMKKVAGNYEPLYTERKFNVEHIASTEVDPSNREWAQITGDHVVNVHCLGNLEPFRWSPPSYVQRCVQSSIRDGGGTGLHLYPRKAWRWPYGCDIGEPQVQWDRDWLWFETWGRYAWNPNRDRQAERRYWMRRLARRYGSVEAGGHLFNAFEEMADTLPAVQRLFWLGNDNHTTAASGMTLEQIQRSSGIPFLDVAGMIRMPEYIEACVSGTTIDGTNPIELFAEKVAEAERALDEAEKGATAATMRKDDADRIRTDALATLLLARFYHAKVQAAVAAALVQQRIDPQANAAACLEHLEASMVFYRELVTLTNRTYASLSDVPMWYPIRGLEKCPYHWSHILPHFERELDIVRHNVRVLQKHPGLLTIEPPVLMPVAITARNPKQEVHTVAAEAKVFTDREFTFGEDVPPEFVGLPSIRFSNERAKAGPCPVPLTVRTPVRVFVAFQSASSAWAKPPHGWTAYLRGWPFRNVSTDIFWRDFPAGDATVQFPKGTFIIMGFTRQNADPVQRPYVSVKIQFLREMIDIDNNGLWSKAENVPGPVD